MQDNNLFSRSLLALACGAALTGFNHSVQASGFAVPELNVAGLALSNALVANPEMQAAIAYNPAAMAFHEGSSLSLGAILVQPDLSVDPEEASYSAPGFTVERTGSIDSDANDMVAIPTISAHTTLSERWALGIAVNAPFGLETDWEPGVFDSQYPIGAAIPSESKLEIVALSPSVSYKVNDNVSFAGGIDVYDMRTVIFNSSINTGSPSTNPSVDLEGEGRGIGLNLGLMVRHGNWTFGGSYHSEARIPIEGELKTPSATVDVESELNLPSRLQLGVRHQTTGKLAIEFDFTRTGWSSFDILEVDESNFNVNVLTSYNEFDDANAYRLGVTYDISKATQLRAGYTFDETPQDDDFFSPRIPDSDRQLFSFGIGHTLDNGWTIDAGYMYVVFDDRTLDIADTFSHPAPIDSENNGTAAVNGKYESSVQLFSVGITRKFM